MPTRKNSRPCTGPKMSQWRVPQTGPENQTHSGKNPQQEHRRCASICAANGPARPKGGKRKKRVFQIMAGRQERRSLARGILGQRNARKSSYCSKARPQGKKKDVKKGWGVVPKNSNQALEKKGSVRWDKKGVVKTTNRHIPVPQCPRPVGKAGERLESGGNHFQRSKAIHIKPRQATRSWNREPSPGGSSKDLRHGPETNGKRRTKQEPKGCERLTAADTPKPAWISPEKPGNGEARSGQELLLQKCFGIKENGYAIVGAVLRDIKGHRSNQKSARGAAKGWKEKRRRPWSA